MFAARNMMIAGGAFNPLSLSPALWLDASDASTLYDATSGGSLVVADGGVARWEDKSGNARHATQTTSGNRPLRKTANQNGKDVCRFDGNNDLLETSATTPSVSAITLFVVEKHNGFGGGGFGRLIEIGTNDFVFLTYSVSTAFRLASGGSLFKDSANNSATTGAFRIAVAVYETNSDAGMSHHINTVESDGTFQAGSPNSFSSKTLKIGNRPALDRAFAGDIAEILVFPTALSTPDRQAVETYLNAKWAIY